MTSSDFDSDDEIPLIELISRSKSDSAELMSAQEYLSLDSDIQMHDCDDLETRPSSIDDCVVVDEDDLSDPDVPQVTQKEALDCTDKITYYLIQRNAINELKHFTRFERELNRFVVRDKQTTQCLITDFFMKK